MDTSVSSHPPGDLARWRQIGDPLADAVMRELEVHDSNARKTLQRGIAEGLASLDSAPPAITAFLENCEQAGAAATDAMQRGSEAYLSIGATWIALALGPGSLTHTYSSPSIAKVLVKTGNLIGMAERRLLETGKWNTVSVVPGALVAGAAGYVHNVQVRLLHSRVRHALQKGGWSDASEMPINQLELTRTWLDFTYVPFSALERLGIRFTEDELGDLYALWHRIAVLLGVDPALYSQVTDQASGACLLARIDDQSPTPDENSRQLTAAMLEAVATLLAPRLGFGRPFALALARAILRRLHGDILADQLNVPRTSVSLLLPLIVSFNRIARFRMRRSPARRNKAIKATMGAFDEADRELEGETTYEQALRDSVDMSLPATGARPSQRPTAVKPDQY